MRVIPASNHDRLFSVPDRVIGHYLRMSCHILWGKLRGLVRLSVDPTEGLQLPKISANEFA